MYCCRFRYSYSLLWGLSSSDSMDVVLPIEGCIVADTPMSLINGLGTIRMFCLLSQGGTLNRARSLRICGSTLFYRQKSADFTFSKIRGFY